jgi:membrane associated rhomboid family serine protease
MSIDPDRESLPFATAHCYRHPDRQTNVACSRCERPICPDCMQSAPVGFHCPNCVRETSGRTATRPYGGAVATHTGAAASAVTIGLGVLNVGMFVITAARSTAGINQNQTAPLFGRLVLNPNVIAFEHQYYRLITSAFLHYGLIHLAVNMFSLAMLGVALERVFGWSRFLALYAVSALGSGVAVYLFDNPRTETAGASGAIFGLFGALIIVYRKLGLDMRALIPTIAINIFINLRVPNISWLGHLGGLVTGAVVAALIVYAPRERRTLIQAAGVLIVVAALVGLTLWRTDMIRSG